jgi:hypothetical protein
MQMTATRVIRPLIDGGIIEPEFFFDFLFQLVDNSNGFSRQGFGPSLFPQCLQVIAEVAVSPRMDLRRLTNPFRIDCGNSSLPASSSKFCFISALSHDDGSIVIFRKTTVNND